MRLWLRKWCSHIWVLHLTPEGQHAPAANQIFEAMRQPVAVVTAARVAATRADEPAIVRYHMVSAGTRKEKLERITQLNNPESEAWMSVPAPAKTSTTEEVSDDDTEEVSDDELHESWRGPFIPAAGDKWQEMAHLEDLLPWHGNGVRAGRTWPISPHKQTLHNRWKKLVNEPNIEKKRELFADGGGQKVDRNLKADKLFRNAPSKAPISEEPAIAKPESTGAVRRRGLARPPERPPDLRRL